MSGENFRFSSRGVRLYDLARALRGISRDDFLLTYSQPFLLQVPSQDEDPPPPQLKIASDQDQKATASWVPQSGTIKVSPQEVAKIKKSRQSNSALVFMLPPVRTGESVIVGRAPDCDIVLDHPSVSRRHSDLHHKQGAWAVMDLRSQNGTFVEGKKTEAGESRGIQAGLNLGFATYQTIFMSPEQVYGLAKTVGRWG